MRLTILGMIACFLVAACGGNAQEPRADSSASGKIQRGLVGVQQPTGSPVDGGTLNFAVYSEVSSLDPARLHAASGTTGGIELAAIYDVLMRYDPESGEFVPQLARSLRHSDDHHTWTLTLREGVTFSDGTPLDAQAVKFSINRYVEQQGTLADLIARFVDEITTPDPHTVVFQLTKPWSNFAYLLSDAPGMIVSPAAAQKWGKKLGRHPVGAGPFALRRHAPGEELVLAANPNYWDGRPHLNKLRFVPFQKAQARLDTLNSGGVDAAFLRDSKVIAEALQQGHAGYLNLVNLGGVFIINNRKGRPGADVRVRRAISYAVDPEVVFQRTFNLDKTELAGKALFQDFSRWHTGVKPLPYDPAKANRLLSQAKANGYDGRIEISYPQGTTGKRQALVLQAMLTKVGFNATTDPVRTTQDIIRMLFVEHNYDISIGGTNTPDAAPYSNLHPNLAQLETSIFGYHNERMAELLEKLSAATTYEAKLRVMAGIQRQWNKTVPSVVWGAREELITWQEDVHGIVPAGQSVVLFDDAWISQR